MAKKNYEIPISPTYVHNWGIKEAIREILQNMIDGDRVGFKGYTKYNKETGTLSIINEGAKLKVSSLVLGCSDKQDNDEMIGHYGEGYKLALVVLLRNKKSVKIFNGDKLWVPTFKISNKFGVEVLNIATEPYEGNKDLIFEVGGISETLYSNLKLNFPIIDKDYGKYIESENGWILLDKRFCGKMFVEGLYVQTDENFKYGYNFKSSIVDLDRDRRAINYYELKKLTAASVVTAEHCAPEIFRAISDSYTDVKDIKEVLDDASTTFLEEYRDMLYKEKNLEENTLVATDSVVKQLRQMEVDAPIVKGSEIESYLIAKANDKLGLIYEAEYQARIKSNTDDAIDYLIISDFRLLMEWFYKYKKYLPKQAIKEFEHEVAYQLEPSDVSYISEYIPKNFKWTVQELKDLRVKIKEKDQD